MSLAKLHPKTVVEVTSCEPHVVAAVLSRAEEMCKELGIIQGNALTDVERMAVTDEKGFSARPGSLHHACFADSVLVSHTPTHAGNLVC